jgi:hypothetical protein
MSNVRHLHALHPERRAALKQFFADQAAYYMDLIQDPQGGAAALHIAVTGVSQVATKLAAVDPEHAAVLLAELDRVRADLLQYVQAQAPDLWDRQNGHEGGQAGNVVALMPAGARGRRH